MVPEPDSVRIQSTNRARGRTRGPACHTGPRDAREPARGCARRCDRRPRRHHGQRPRAPRTVGHGRAHGRSSRPTATATASFEAARAAQAGGATWLGTAQQAEAVALRDAGFEGRIFTWLHVPGNDFAAALTRDIDVAASATWSLDDDRRGRPRHRTDRPRPPQGRHRSGPQRRLRPGLPRPGRRGPAPRGRREPSRSSGSGRTSRTPTSPTTRRCGISARCSRRRSGPSRRPAASSRYGTWRTPPPP